MFERFEDLFGPVTRDEFVKTYWRKRPLHVRGKPDRYAGLVDRAKFFALAGHPKAEVFAGLPDDKNRFHQIPVSASQAAHLFDTGFTIQVEDLHHVVPELLQLANMVRDALGIYAAMEAGMFLSPPSRGYPCHFDPNPDIWILQVEGTKKWRYSASPAVSNPLVQTVMPRAGAPRGDPWYELDRPDVSTFIETDLEPGDLLYFPGGLWHAAEAVHESFHVVMASTNETWTDVLFELLRPELLARAEWRDVGDGTPLDAPELSGQVERRLAELKEAVGRLRMEDVSAALDRGRAARASGAYRQQWKPTR
jgi:50S ribosomal protein L16 3-hydroxylase